MAGWDLLLVHALAVFWIGLFTAGFISPDGIRISDAIHASAPEFPTVLEFEKVLENAAINSSQNQRMVLMVIDALRDDFLDRKVDLPFISGELNAGRACRLTVKVDTPTVTMPRIKSLVTGRSSQFVDVILNLGSAELQAPNLVKNVGPDGVVFYGDDTWLKLLPNAFLRFQGTHSFFVNDFYEVDTNVTRNVPGEMKKKDWTLLILHYLGLDHIGHVEGPRSSLIGPKLLEMDSVARLILEGASNQSPKPLLLITGDHGMHNGGGHGGATSAERTVGLVLLGAPCGPGKFPEHWAQIDLAPTMAVLLGAEVPKGSVGALVPPLLTAVGHQKALTALFTNTRRLLSQLPGYEQETLFFEGMRLHQLWMQNQDDETALKATESYSSAAVLLRDRLATSQVPFDLYAMGLGAVGSLLCAVAAFVFIGQNRKSKLDAFRVCITAAALAGAHSAACGLCNGRSLACSLSPLGMNLQLAVAFATAWTIISVITQFQRHYLVRKGWNWLQDWPFIFLAIGHTFSLGSSFCVEEEHLVWYVVWPLVLVVACVRWPRRWQILLLAALGHVLLTQFNSTGDKWASTPDLEDFLSSRPVARSGLLAVSLLMLLPLIDGGRPLAGLLLTLIYAQKAANTTVLMPFFDKYLSPNGLAEAWCFYSILATFLAFRLWTARSFHRVAAWRDTWLLLAALLCRPHDVLALAYVAFASRLMATCLRGPAAAVGIAAAGWTGFFYQGNSNGLASLDVAAGYVGLQSYQPLLVGGQLAAHTYAAPVLAALELCTARGSGQWLYVWSGQRLLAAAFYLLVAAWLREHLFIWSVFAPKLLFEAAHSLLFLLLLIPICLFIS